MQLACLPSQPLFSPFPRQWTRGGCFSVACASIQKAANMPSSHQTSHQRTPLLCAARVPPLPAVNMRRVVSFSFYPEGYEWAEPAPTVLSEGLQGQLPCVF